jgi:hypothetical protein
MNITNTTNNIDSNTVDLFTIIIEYIEHTDWVSTPIFSQYI